MASLTTVEGMALIRQGYDEDDSISMFTKLDDNAYCQDGYYTGWKNDPDITTMTLNQCAEICKSESKCLFFSFKATRTCSRYDYSANGCLRRIGDHHQTYAKKSKILQTNSPNMRKVTSPSIFDNLWGYSLKMPGPIYGIINNKYGIIKLISIGSNSQDIIKKDSKMYWTNWFSEEKTDLFGNKLKHQGDCMSDYVVNQVQCDGSFCDNIRLLCARLVSGYIVGNDATTDGTEACYNDDCTVKCNNGYYVTGMECSGGHCNNHALHCTRVKYY